MGLQHEHCTTTKWNCLRFAIDTSSNPFIFWFHPPSIISNICWISSQYNSSLFLRGFNTLLIWFGYTGDLMLVRTCLSHHHLQISRNSLPARIVLLFNMFALYEIDLWFINSWFLSNIIFWLLIAQTHSHIMTYSSLKWNFFTLDTAFLYIDILMVLIKNQTFYYMYIIMRIL